MDLQRYKIEKALTPEQGIARVWEAGLCLNDEETSAVLVLVAPYYKTDPSPVRDVWLVRDLQSQRDAGMVMIRTPCEDSGPRSVLNLYVHADHQQQGLGKALLDVAQTHYSGQSLAGYYTLDACRLYQQAGLFPAMIQRNDQTFPLLEEGNVEAAAALYVDQVLRERQAFEEEMVAHQRRRQLRPF